MTMADFFHDRCGARRTATVRTHVTSSARAPLLRRTGRTTAWRRGPQRMVAPSEGMLPASTAAEIVKTRMMRDLIRPVVSREVPANDSCATGIAEPVDRLVTLS